MSRILLQVAYDGTSFSGYALQGDKRTVERCLNEALTQFTDTEVTVIGASRTDAGVHAYGNLAVFDTASPVPAERFARILDRFLPADLRVVRSCEVPADFHPRHTGAVKTYEYRIRNTAVPDPIADRYSYRYSYPLDPAQMREAAAYLVGEHDFTSFCNPETQSPTRVREITGCSLDLRISEKGDMRDPELILHISGKGFLYHQVRIITGTLLEVGRGLKKPGDIPQILAARDRRLAGFTAPPQGLFLIGYDLQGMI